MRSLGSLTSFTSESSSTKVDVGFTFGAVLQLASVDAKLLDIETASAKPVMFLKAPLNHPVFGGSGILAAW